MMWAVLVVSLVVAFSFQGYSIWRISLLADRLQGRIRTREDLQMIKEVINLNMRMAIAYIVFWFLLIAVLIWTVVARLLLFPQAITVFFLFGVITLPLGLVGKSFEKKVHALRAESGDAALEETFHRWLKEWKEPRFQLPE
jgi:hypothetical protein